jgi:hypothetical protein
MSAGIVAGTAIAAGMKSPFPTSSVEKNKESLLL